jgi:hypothetical protein
MRNFANGALVFGLGEAIATIFLFILAGEGFGIIRPAAWATAGIASAFLTTGVLIIVISKLRASI